MHTLGIIALVLAIYCTLTVQANRQAIYQLADTQGCKVEFHDADFGRVEKVIITCQ